MAKLVLSGVAVLIILLWGVMLAIALTHWRDATGEQLGQLGDAFGAANALFSGAALIGVVAAIVLQHAELKESVRALRDQHASMESQLQHDRESRFRAQTIKLYDVWSQAIVAHRRHVAEFVKTHVAPHLPGADGAHVRLGKYDSQADSSANRNQLLAVTDFFRYWAALEAAGELDVELMRRLIGPEVQWWRENYIRWIILTSSDAGLKDTMSILYERFLNYNAEEYAYDQQGRGRTTRRH